MPAGGSVELLPWTRSSLLVFGLICYLSGTVGGAGARIIGCAGLKDYLHLVHEIRIAHSCSLNQIHFLPALPPNHTVCCVPGFWLSSGKPVLVATRVRLYELVSPAKGAQQRLMDHITPLLTCSSKVFSASGT